MLPLLCLLLSGLICASSQASQMALRSQLKKTELVKPKLTPAQQRRLNEKFLEIADYCTAEFSYECPGDVPTRCVSSEREIDRAIRELRDLQRQGADINAQDKYGQTALMQIASDPTLVRIVEALINMGAAIDCKNRLGTALHRAVWGKNRAVMRILLLKGADTAIQNKDGKSFTDYLEPIRERDDVRTWTLKEFCQSVHAEMQAEQKESAAAEKENPSKRIRLEKEQKETEKE